MTEPITREFLLGEPEQARFDGNYNKRGLSNETYEALRSLILEAKDE